MPAFIRSDQLAMNRGGSVRAITWVSMCDRPGVMRLGLPVVTDAGIPKQWMPHSDVSRSGPPHPTSEIGSFETKDSYIRAVRRQFPAGSGPL